MGRHFVLTYSIFNANHRLGLWCLMPLSTIFHLYHGGHGNQKYWFLKQITYYVGLLLSMSCSKKYLKYIA
jgi:hypothetical protein